MFVSEERNKGERGRENENMNVRKIHNFFALVRDFPKNGGNKIINKAGFFSPCDICGDALGDNCSLSHSS